MIFDTLDQFPPSKALSVLVRVAPVIAISGGIAVETAFALSRYPVPLIEGQLAFDSDLIKSYYAILQQQGTFGTYVATQIIDYGLIVGMFLTGFVLHVAMGRAYAPGSWGRRLNYIAAFFLPYCASMDALENVTSFFMLANPTGFADWLGSVYSTFAALKMVGAPLGMGALLIALAAFGVMKLRQRGTAQAKEATT